MQLARLRLSLKTLRLPTFRGSLMAAHLLLLSRLRQCGPRCVCLLQQVHLENVLSIARMRFPLSEEATDVWLSSPGIFSLNFNAPYARQ